MQYMLMIFEDERAYEGGPESLAWQQIVQAHGALVGKLQEAGILRGGAGLLPTNTATSLRTRAGKTTVHDGPYAETREQLGGFYLIDVPDLETALQWAKQIPMIADGTIEVRRALDE
jgi:hypothetical protein